VIHPCALIACPKCGADPKYKCFTKSGRSMRGIYHVARIRTYWKFRTAPREEKQ